MTLQATRPTVPTGAVAPTRRGSRRARRRRWLGLLYLSPALLLYAAIVLAPLAQTMNFSLYKWDGVSEPSWVGLRNYLNFGRDPRMLGRLGTCSS